MLQSKQLSRGYLSISIITIVFNNEKTLEQTICSVLDQSYPHIEYIIVDGGSTDGSLDIIKKYNDKVKWISEPDNGIADAFNKGLGLATGDIIGIINSDDWYEPNIFEQIIKDFEVDIDLLCGDINLFSGSGQFLRRRASRPSMTNYGMYLMHPSVFVRKSVYQEVGNFDTSLKIAMDFDFILRVKKHGFKVKYINAVVASMRTNGISSNGVLMHQEELRVIRTHLKGVRLYTSVCFHYLSRGLSRLKRLLK